MKHHFLLAAGIGFFLAACATVQYTGRKQFNLVSPEQEAQLGEQAYQEILQKTPLTKNADYQRRIREIGARIQAVANEPSFKWEFNVLQGKEVNAFCLPGGKVAFWDGIMPICESDAGVAVVMGHEVAHALAHHGAERMSQGMGAEIIGELLSMGLGKASPEVRNGAMQAFGLGAQVGVILPFSRKHESEADKIGLILMAKAGYDPRTAVDFWKRMAQSGGQKPPEFLSSHPSDETRIKQIESWLPEALSYYKP
ncbi:MAG: Beta-barrel assembly-enhancing protease [Elusimicrobia bacterium]|nr:Beta-barrel assembly-enhancing protease [Elusimicrobiota bacterium]